jgi:hydrophobic/amphiphilic exporter-1 (mainly G- bacteria), HAE1 family
MPLSNISVRRPVTILMFYAGIALLGIVALLDLTVDFLPGIDVPALTIQTTCPNASPEEVEYAITAPVETAIGAIAGVKRIRSVTREGMSVVSVTFYWGTRMDFAMLEVREKLDAVRGSFPRDAGRPNILRIDPTVEPVMTVAVSSNMTGPADATAVLAELKETARALVKRRIEQVEGVAQAAVLGGLDREIHVDVEMAALRAQGLEIGQVGDALDAANVNLPGGTIRQGLFRYSLRTLGALTSIEDIRDVVVRRSASGREVRIADCATVREAHIERAGLTRYNGEEVIIVEVRKEAGANTVAVCRSVHETLVQLQKEYPELGLAVIADQAGFISRSIADVEQAIIIGGILAFLVLFYFLRKPRYPLIIGLTMPVSLLATIVAMYFLKISLNVISLTGLALGIGMLGDNAIVLVENVTRLREQGVPLRDATVAGAQEIGTAVTASTLTNVAIFLPIVFVEGVAAQLFVDMGITMTISLLVSLLVAVTLVPMLVSREGSAARWKWASSAGVPMPACIPLHGARAGRRMGQWFDASDAWCREAVERYLLWALTHRMTVVLWTLGLLLLTGIVALSIPAEPAPDIDQNRFVVHLRMPRGTSLEGVNIASRALEDELRALPGVGGVCARVGITEERSLWNPDGIQRESAELDVRTEDGIQTASLLDSARACLARRAGTTYGMEYAVKPRGTSFERILRPEQNDIRCMVIGKDPVIVEKLAGSYAEAVRPVRGLVDLRASLQEGTPEYHITIDRDAAARHGLTVQAVAAHLSRLARGIEATALSEFDRRTTIRVLPSGNTGSDLNAILASDVPAGDRRVPVRALVTCRKTHGYAEIWREDGQRTQVLVANASGRSVGSIVADLEHAAASLGCPPGYEVRIGGENQEIEESFRDLFSAIVLSLFMVFMILAAEYESTVYPLVILLTSPLAAVGAIIGMALAGQHYNVMSLVGLVIMIGAVDNDAVIVVDVIIGLRREGVCLRDAILQGIRQRLRPILMTTATTVLGIIPLIFEFGTGSELVRALTVPIVGGLITSTVASIAVIPVGVSFVEKRMKSEEIREKREE